MKRLILCGLLSSAGALAQAQPPLSVPVVSVRLSLLVLPATPLLTVELRAVGNLTVQGETNFVHTHGVNLKYYPNGPFERGYWFVGSAWVQNRFLRADGGSAVLPYAGWGYAHRFGRTWQADGRLGFGPTLNADRNSVYPVLKLGVGKRF
jgi:hypothetical protein